MAGWITAFKVIPWTDLISAAPAVVTGARKLWAAVRKNDAAAAAGQGPESGQQALGGRVEALRRELAAASELVAELAEQNGRLVEAVEILRARTRALIVIAAILAVAVTGLAIAIALK